jgi:hypothetical protein
MLPYDKTTTKTQQMLHCTCVISHLGANNRVPVAWRVHAAQRIACVYAAQYMLALACFQ